MSRNLPRIERLANYIVGGLSGSATSGQRMIYAASLKELFKFTVRFESEDAMRLFKIWLESQKASYKNLYFEEAEDHQWDTVDDYSDPAPWDEQRTRTDGQRYYGHIFDSIGAIEGFLWSLERE